MVAPQIHNVDIEDMAPNSGATVQKGLRKVAVYKDSEGKKHAFSALCPHLGCLLQVREHTTMYICMLTQRAWLLCWYACLCLLQGVSDDLNAHNEQEYKFSECLLLCWPTLM